MITKFKTYGIFSCMLVLLALALTSPCHAQNSARDYLKAHNAARAAVGVGPIRWSNTLATYARNYARKRIRDCALRTSGGPYGENLAWSSGGSLTGAGAVKLWVKGKASYNYRTNRCINGVNCLTYTQVVWRKSVRLGCARVRCSTGGTFVICSYDPPGNVIGKRPY